MMKKLLAILLIIIAGCGSYNPAYLPEADPRYSPPIFGEFLPEPQPLTVQQLREELRRNELQEQFDPYLRRKAPGYR